VSLTVRIHFLPARKGLMPRLCLANEFISRGDGLHCEFACLLCSNVKEDHRLEEFEIHDMFELAVQTEMELFKKPFQLDSSD